MLTAGCILKPNKKEKRSDDMDRYTKQDVIDLVRENDVQFIRLQFSDVFGTLKNVAITADSWKKHWIISVCLTDLPWTVLCG